MDKLSVDRLFGNEGSFIDVSFESETLSFAVFVGGRRFDLAGQTDFIPTVEADNHIPIYVRASDEVLNVVLERMRVVYPNSRYPLTLDEAIDAVLSALNEPVRRWNSLYLVFFA